MDNMSTNQNNNKHLIKVQFVGLLLLVVEEKLQLYSLEKQLEPKQVNRVAAQLLTEGREK
jgi:hypothetical protein